MRDKLLIIAASLLAFVAAGCGPGYAIYQSSGSLAGANPVGLAFDYSGAIHTGHLPEEQWLAQRNQEELAAYQILQDQFQTIYAQTLANRSGRDIVPASSNEPVTLTVTFERFVLGRYIPFGATATQVFARMRFSQQGQLTDEIYVECVQGAGLGTTKEGRLGQCAQIVAARTAHYLNTQ